VQQGFEQSIDHVEALEI